MIEQRVYIDLTATEKQKLIQVLDRNDWLLSEYIQHLLVKDLETVKLLERWTDGST